MTRGLIYLYQLGLEGDVGLEGDGDVSLEGDGDVGRDGLEGDQFFLKKISYMIDRQNIYKQQNMINWWVGC